MQIIRDSVWKNIELIPVCAKIVQAREFQRLNKIKQLGPTFLVYPGATHTRFSHSLGVYHLATRLIQNLCEKEINLVDFDSIKAFQIAALCHDLGHFPFTHALKELPLKEHEVLTSEIILNTEIAHIIEDEGLDPNFVAAIIDKNIPTTNSDIIFYRKLLSGVLDPDKLDYLNRDAFYCGVPYGLQDTDYTLSCVLPDKNRGITINSKSIVAVENLLFSKYLMYRTVYWHKTVRIATAMMKKTLFSAISSGKIHDTDLYNLCDDELFAIINKKSQNDSDEIFFPAKMFYAGQIFSIIFETPFNDALQNHLMLENLDFRAQKEKEIAKILKCRQSQVLLDVPERISFESDLWIHDEGVPFSESETVFSKDVVRSFTEKLRFIRIAVDKTIVVPKDAVYEIRNLL